MFIKHPKHIYKIIFILLLIFILFHFKKYKTTKQNYEILQINKKMVDYSTYLNELYPIVILNHDISDLSSIVSPLTIQKKYIEDFNKQIKKTHMYHNKDGFFIISNSDTNIHISTPFQLKYFKKGEYNQYVKTLNPINSKYTSITIKLKKGNILSIPRYWIFNIEGDVSIFLNNTIFTSIFTFYELFNK